MEYTTELTYGSYIFSWRASSALPTTFVLQYDLSHLIVILKEPSFSTVKLWVIGLRRTSRMISSRNGRWHDVIYPAINQVAYRIRWSPLDNGASMKQSIWRICSRGNFCCVITGIHPTQYALVMEFKQERSVLDLTSCGTSLTKLQLAFHNTKTLHQH